MKLKDLDACIPTSQVEFDLIVAVAKASGINLRSEQITYNTEWPIKHIVHGGLGGCSHAHNGVDDTNMMSVHDWVLNTDIAPEWTVNVRQSIDGDFFYTDGGEMFMSIDGSEQGIGIPHGWLGVITRVIPPTPMTIDDAYNVLGDEPKWIGGVSAVVLQPLEDGYPDVVVTGASEFSKVKFRLICTREEYVEYVKNLKHWIIHPTSGEEYQVGGWYFMWDDKDNNKSVHQLSEFNSSGFPCGSGMWWDKIAPVTELEFAKVKEAPRKIGWWLCNKNGLERVFYWNGKQWRKSSTEAQQNPIPGVEPIKFIGE